MIREIFSALPSTNGRRGLAIVAETEVTFPAEGKLTLLGTFEGVRTFKFTADECGQWIYAGGDIVPIAGAVVVARESLQSGEEATIIVGRGFFVIRSFGYNRRRSEIIAYKDGAKIKLLANAMVAMAAMGLIQAENKPVIVKIPAIESKTAEALRSAGVL